MESVKIVKVAPEDAEAIIAYTKQIGSESENLMYGPEGIGIEAEREKEMIKKDANSDKKVFLLAKCNGENH